MASRYGSLSVPQLKTELRKRGAKISGRKVDLVERLEGYARNDNFGQTEQMQDEYRMKVPTHDLFKDLHADMNVPSINPENISIYLSQFEKKLDQNCKDLYTEKYIDYIRSTHEHNIVYFKACCRAQMKLGISYVIDITCSEDGDIVETQCECAAGMGPGAHCKHVCAVLFGLSQFSLTKVFTTFLTCTDRLQSFNKSRRHLGSPVKSENVSVSVSENPNIDFDPRPRFYRNTEGYGDYFRNVCLNYKGMSTAPIFQLFIPANPYAVVNDHDYLSLSPEEHYLKVIGVSEISDNAISEVERLTRLQSKSSMWFEQKQIRIGSSMFGKICNATERTDLKALATSLTDMNDLSSLKPIAHGRHYEAKAVKCFEEVSNCKTKKCGLFVCKDYPYLASSPDRIVDGVDGRLLVEVKCPYTCKDQLITNITVPYLVHTGNGELTLKQNHQYYYQVQGQMLCTGAQRVEFVVYTLKDMKIMPIQRNNIFIKLMLNKLQKFYQTYFREALLNSFLYRNYDKYIFEG